MNNFIFLNPYYFLVIIPILWIIGYLFFSKKNKLKFSFFKDLENIYKKNNFFYYLFFFLLIFISIFYVVILANPNIKNTKEEIIKNWIDIVLVFDISYSMEAKDLFPSRVELAKTVIFSFLEKLKNDRVWLVVFAWKPFTSIPLTYDYKFLQEYIKSVSTNTINQNNPNLRWTAIWDAILMWTNLFDKDSKDREKTMILLTDWDANKWLSPLTALKLLKEKNIKTYTIWIWELNSKDYNEEILKKIANETSWKFYRASSNKIFYQVFDDISKLEKKEIKTEIKRIFTTSYDFFYNVIFILNLLFLILLFKRIKV